MPRVYNKSLSNVPDDAVYIGRPTKWGNPFVVGVDGTRQYVIDLYEQLVTSDPEVIAEIRSELRGKNLVCWCSPKACHGDVLLRIANSKE